MREHIGYCSICQKEIYCMDGFLNGVIINSTTLLECFSCNETKESKKTLD